MSSEIYYLHGAVEHQKRVERARADGRQALHLELIDVASVRLAPAKAPMANDRRGCRIDFI